MKKIIIMFREADYMTSLGSLLDLSFDENTSIGSQVSSKS